MALSCGDMVLYGIAAGLSRGTALIPRLAVGERVANSCQKSIILMTQNLIAFYEHLSVTRKVLT
jgi:hypothetical protein